MSESSVSMVDVTGAFAENKDKARNIRTSVILPALGEGREIELDFDGVDLTTQSFIHALISEPLMKHGSEALTLLKFKGCNGTVKDIVRWVVDYTLNSSDAV